ncbi:MAG: T9SS type A sorting domain-containing protein [Bacteroidota bacterium]|jgi:hypothetical protein
MKRLVVVVSMLALLAVSAGMAQNLAQARATGNWSDNNTWNSGKTGTISFDSGATAVTGVGTYFTTELAPGIDIYFSGGVKIGTIASIANNQHLTLVTGYSSKWTGIAYAARIVPMATDSVLIRADRVITVDIGSAKCRSIFLGWSTWIGKGTIVFGASTDSLVVSNIVGGDSAIINMNSGGTLVIGGSFTGNLYAFYPGSGTVQYTSYSAQTVKPLTYYDLVFSGSGTKTAGGNITVNGALTNPGTLDMSTYSLTASSIDNTGGTVQFRGSTNGLPIETGTVQYLGVSQTVSGGNYNNLYISQNNGDASLGGTASVYTNLTLGGCNLILGSYDLYLSGSVTGAGAGTCVVTNGSGYVSRSVANAGSFTFPIGPSTTAYNPVSMNNNTGLTNTYTAKVAVGDNPTTADNTQAGNQTWTLTGTATDGLGVSLFFTWLTTDAGVNVTPSSAVAWYYTGTAWVELGGTTSAGTPNVTTVSGVTLLSSVIIGNPGALPIQLASLTANAISNSVKLEWQTISETNSLGFYVERGSSKTGPFTVVNSVIIAGAGTSLEQHNYSYTDNNVSSGTYYYRLHQVDRNGSGSYSSVITVTVSGVLGVGNTKPLPTEFALGQNYPDPFNPTTAINYELPKAEYVRLVVYDMLGREVATLVNGTQDAGYKSVEFNAANLPSGIYTYRLTAGTFVEVKKMLMIK